MQEMKTLMKSREDMQKWFADKKQEFDQ